MSKKSDKAFIEKLKTINIGTGAKPSKNCGNCGKPMSEHEMKLVAVGVAIPVPASMLESKPEPKHNEEASFAA